MKKAKRLANLKSFEPGQCGNPKGRPVEPQMLKDLRAACKAADNAGMIFDALMKLVRRGNIRAIEIAAHYAAGKPVEVREVRATVPLAAVDLTPTQRKQIAEALLGGY